MAGPLALSPRGMEPYVTDALNNTDASLLCQVNY